MSCNPNVNDDNTPLLGVVLSGGNSSRMEKDKELLQKGNQGWSKVTFEKFESLGIPVVISINSSQKEAYRKRFSADQIVVDKFEIAGPLRGIFSVHDQFPHHDLLVIASDLPDLSISLIENLLNVFEENAGEYDFVVYSIQNALEPLFGLYTAEGLNKIFSLFISNQLEKVSMKYILEIGNTFPIELEPDHWKALKNYNSKADTD